MNVLWVKKKRSKTGRVVTAEAAISKAHLAPWRVIKERKPRAKVNILSSLR